MKRPLFSFGIIFIQAWGENNNVELETRHFRKELRLKILKLRGIVVVVHQFSKLKQILFQERSIFHFPLLGLMKPVEFLKNRF